MSGHLNVQHISKRFTVDGVLDVRGMRHIFVLGVPDDQFRNIGSLQGDVDILVNGRGNKKSAVFAVIGGQVRPTTAE